MLKNRKKNFFYDPVLTPMDFLGLFLSVSDINEFNSNDLERFIIECQEKNLFTELLKEFDVLNAADSKYSLEYRKAAIEATFENIVFELDSDSKDKILISNVNDFKCLVGKEDYVESMEEFIASFLKMYPIKVATNNANSMKR